jgi:hypothetical protein
MIKLYLTFIFLFAASLCLGQAHQLDKDTTKYKNTPIYILKTSKRDSVQTSAVSGILPIDIDSITVYKIPGFLPLYGRRAENGVVVIQLKKGVELLNFSQLLNTFNIPASKRNLPAFLDSTIVYQSQNAYFEAAAIKYIKIEQEKGVGTNYISIRTIFPITHQNAGGFVLKGKVNIIDGY